MIQLESAALSSAVGTADSTMWGTSSTLQQSGATGTVAAGNSKESGMYVLQAWILHQGSGLFGVPALVKIGHMPVTIGTGLFYDHSYQGDDAALFGIDPVKGLHIILGTVKHYEGSSAKNDDITAYTTIVSYDFAKDSSIGMDVTYLDAQNGSFPAIAGADTHFINLGINAKGVIPNLGVSLYGEVDLQGGKMVDLGPGTPDQKFRGWAAKTGAKYTFSGPVPVTVGGEFAYGSGDQDGSADNKFSTFVTSQGQTQHFTYVYDYRTVNAAGNYQGGLQNTWYLKASAAADITKALSAGMDLYSLHAVKNNATVAPSTGVYTTAGTSKNIGIEVDGKVNYKIDRNLNYFVEGGYLFAGNFWKKNGDSAFNPDDAFVLRHGIQLSS
jgi:hypothetical protein